MAKVPRAVMETRIAEIKNLLLEGHTRPHILRYGASSWDLSVRQIDKYIQAATAEILEISKNTTEKTLSLLTSNLWELYRVHRTQKPALARMTLMSIGKLNGLDRMDVTVHFDRPNKEATDEEVAAAAAGM